MPEPPAGERDWLAEHARVVWLGDHLAVRGDGKSGFGIAVRRQLAALGPLPATVLAVGVSRARPELRATGPGGVLAWAQAQPGLSVADDLVAVIGDSESWLSPVDRALLALGPEQLSWSRMIEVLCGEGLTPGAAAVWLTRCSWLRPSGVRGRYIRASSLQGPEAPGPGSVDHRC